MKKTIFIILFIIMLLGTIGKLIGQNYDKLKEYYDLYTAKKEIQVKYDKTKEDLDTIKKTVIENNKETKINPKIIDLVKKRYLFKYNDYRGLNILSVKRIKDINENKYYFKVKLQYLVQKSGTLFAVLNMYYKDNNIEKIHLIDKRNIIIYLKENDILNKIGV